MWSPRAEPTKYHLHLGSTQSMEPSGRRQDRPSPSLVSVQERGVIDLHKKACYYIDNYLSRKIG